jgi:hypothetical protein
MFFFDEVFADHKCPVNAGAILDRVTPRQRGDAAEEN